MAVQPHLYQLFHHRPSDALVAALWDRLFPKNKLGQNTRLDEIFLVLSNFPEQATLPLCPYYFDQVTSRPPPRDQVTQRNALPSLEARRDHCNLRLNCFHSWANGKEEWQRASEQHFNPNGDAAGPGPYLSALCQYHNPITRRSISTAEYIHRMYGVSL